MGDIPKSAGHPGASASAEAAASWGAAIVESCGEAIISTSLDGRIIGFNAAAVQLTGYSADEVLGRQWASMVPADAVAEIARAVQRFQAGEKTFRIESHLPRKDGVRLEILLSISAIRDRTGTLIGMSGIFRDITEDKLAQQRLRQSEEKFATVFKYSSTGISIARLIDGEYLDVNDEFCRIMNLPREEVIGRAVGDLGIVTEAELNEFAGDLLQAGAIRNREMTVLGRDGIGRRCLVSSIIVELDGIQCVLSSIKDISDLKRAEDELLRTDRQFSEVLDHAPLAVLAINSDRVITAARGRAITA